MNLPAKIDWNKTEADRGKVLLVAKKAAADGVVVTSAADLTPEAVDWLWRDWLARGKLHVLAGAPGQGKTTLAMAFAAIVSSGGHWPDGTRCTPANVLIWSGEDDPADTLLPRLITMGADRSRVHFITGMRIEGQVRSFDPAQDMISLASAVERIGNVALLIVDPVVSAVTGDSHKNTEVRRALQPLVDLGAALHAAVLGITHFSKGSSGRDPTERVVGSLAFGALPRLVMVAGRTGSAAHGSGQGRVLARSKANNGPDGDGFGYEIEQSELDHFPDIVASRIRWGGAVTGTAQELLSEPVPESEDGAGTAREADEALRHMLRGVDSMEGRDALDCMRRQGFTDKQTRSARGRLGVVIARTGSGTTARSHWSLPAHSCPLVPTHAQPGDGHEWAPVGTSAPGAGDAEVF